MNPVLVALDLPDLERAEALARMLAPHVGGFKVGLELMMSEGPQAVSRISAVGLPVFADAKLHDIPNTAGAAARQLGARGARWVTAHAAGGATMLEAVAEGLGDTVGMLAVTVLTSLGEEDLAGTGVTGTVASQARQLSTLAVSAGAEGVVCSVNEIAVVKEVSTGLLAVIPGIRLDPAHRHDQRRVATPGEAVAAGADLIVVGREITGAADPEAAAIEIADLIAQRPPV